jgi:probable F420-dependent oxidoreductase
MHFGLIFANTGRNTGGKAAAKLARAAEDNGFESLWTVEHVVVPAGYSSPYPYSDTGKMPGKRDDYDIPDPLIWLSFAAAATSTIKLATGIVILPQRNPVVFAKTVATLDSMSEGRMILGVGVGWLEEEFDAIGVPFASRGRRTDDSIRALRALWEQDLPSYDGEFTQFSNTYSRPQPTNGTVPIVIGGHSKAAARRAGRLGDGFFPLGDDVDAIIDLIELARSTATSEGRNPADIEITVGASPKPESMKRLAEAGVSRMVIPAMSSDAMKQFSDTVMSKF